MTNPWQELAGRFRRASERFPNLRHTIIEARDVPAMDLDNLDGCPNYRALARKMGSPPVGLARSRTPNIVHLICCFHRGCEHIFYGDLGGEKAESWGRFRELAAIGTSLALEQNLIQSRPMLRTPASVIAQDFETATWMELVYSLAREKPPTILRAQTSTIWNEQDLPEGITASWLGLEVFTASACAADVLASREPRPSFDRVRRIADRLGRFLEASDLVNRTHTNPSAEMVAMKALFRECVATNEVLGGGPYGDNEIRQPSGWPVEIRVTLANLATDFEQLIGNADGRWGLREWAKLADGNWITTEVLRWPTFGDRRYRPFEFDPSCSETIGRLRETLATLNAAISPTLHDPTLAPAGMNETRLMEPTSDRDPGLPSSAQPSPISTRQAGPRIEISMPGARVLTLDDLARVREAAMRFIHKQSGRWNVAWMDEDDWLGVFGTLADVLRPMREPFKVPASWPHRVGRALPALIRVFDRLTDAWGWHALAEPEPMRTSHARSCHARFHDECLRPWYEAAVSWQEGCPGLHCPVEDEADYGRKLGFVATMSFEEGQERYRPARDHAYVTPRFGDAAPNIDDDAYKELCDAFGLLDAALILIVEQNRQDWYAKSNLPTGVNVSAESMGPTPEASSASREAAPLEDATTSDAWKDLVTLDQAAGMVHKSKRTLERCKTKGEMPDPHVEGGGGKPDLFHWPTLRPWLETKFGIKLPARHPANLK